ncbi:Acylase ACY 1 (plasmid) [Aminobacter sp. MSH1]|uniref:gamma-glutamyltransferase n=1 Tax=Aminobacter sp. MSH1 TaxID=374606 RepID=UPI000D3B5EBD|nr:gamma-glutamyltransferase [Aminobacter sp. MSH1]AWC25826.1 Acylase ACY 1 [Aminobacter sp. MSH1]
MNRFAVAGPSQHLTQNWNVTKPSASGSKGVVVSQSREASLAGCAMLEMGGSAADAVVAAALVLAVVEPWNSGLGGIGYAVIREPDDAAWSLDFGPVAPAAVDIADYPLSGGSSPEIFGWPKVKGDRNVHGPLSFCVPKAVAGLGRLHDRFGRLPWAEVVVPAVACAKRGMPKDWFSTVKIAQMGHLLRQYEEAARIYLPNGLPPVGAEKGNPSFLPQGALSSTLEMLARDGWRSFYEGELASLLVDDMAAVGSRLSSADLQAADASFDAAEHMDWGGHRLFLPSSDCGGGMLREVLPELTVPSARNAEWFSDLAGVLTRASRRRIEGIKAENERQTCTTHLNVCDSDGLTIAFTTSLLGLMGSAVVLPKTGVLMNNGMMWFDPVPGKPNSIGAGVRPQSNMLPVICRTAAGDILSLGASGGRRILPAVLSHLADLAVFFFTPEEAAHLPRIDVSATEQIVVDRRIAEDVKRRLAEVNNVTLCEHAAAPLNFGCPSVLKITNHVATGQPDVMTPWSAACAARDMN